ncbi:MAG: chloromuconate cycloisomerase [Kaistella sp.]|nr:chloromuconate cycloisomerase [Kaistella sp.]
MKVSWIKHRLELKEIFSISYGNYSHRDALLVILSHKGNSGYGECVGIDYYSIDLEVFILKLKQIQQVVESTEILIPGEFYSFLLNLELHPFLRSALDCAYWDLFGKLENKTFCELNQFSFTKLPDSSLTISIAPVEQQIQKIRESDWQKFKVKAKTLDRKSIFSLLDTGKNIALDANSGFSEEDCEFLQCNACSIGFDYVEQPRGVGKYAHLNRNLNVNWMADEDCQNISDLKKLQPHYSSVNIKLMKCGGITPALDFIHEAKNLNFKVMIGCMTESSVGISAGIALAGLCDFADLDGANLIANDYAIGSFVQKGLLTLSEKPGLGISLV